MTAASHFHYRSVHGLLTIATDGEAITHLMLGAFDLPMPFRAHELTNRASTEVLEYLAGKRQIFDLPLAPAGSDFERGVWHEVERIPYGAQMTTRELAGVLGLEASYRRIGAAVNANPIAILIPTHRIVAGSDKSRRSAPNPEIDAALLKLERS